MAFRHGKGTALWADITDLTAYFQEADLAEKVDSPETTVFGSTAKTYVVGQQDGAVSLKGFWDGAALAADSVIQTALGNDVDQVMTLTLESGVGISAVTKMWAALTAEYSINTPVKDVVSTSLSVMANGGIDTGRMLNMVSLSATTNSTGVDNAVLTSNGGVAHLHVPVNTRSTTSTIKVQHSVDNSTYADLVTFTVVGATSTASQRVIVAPGTTVNRYLRAQTTLTAGTGAITPIVSFARR